MRNKRGKSEEVSQTIPMGSSGNQRATGPDGSWAKQAGPGLALLSHLPAFLSEGADAASYPGQAEAACGAPAANDKVPRRSWPQGPHSTFPPPSSHQVPGSQKPQTRGIRFLGGPSGKAGLLDPSHTPVGRPEVVETETGRAGGSRTCRVTCLYRGPRAVPGTRVFCQIIKNTVFFLLNRKQRPGSLA